MVDDTPFLVINPHANEGKTARKIDDILTISRKVLGDFEYKLTSKLGDGIPITKQALNEGFKTILAVGGDGTLNEVINAVANTDINVGMIPTGGSCDAYQTHAIPLNFQRSFDIVSSGHIEKIPIGIAKGDKNRYFIDMVNSGLAGYVNDHEPTWGKPWLTGNLRYTIMAFEAAFKFKPPISKVIVDDQTLVSHLAYFASGLSNIVAGYELLPGNHPKKGKLGVAVIKDIKGFKFLAAMMKLSVQSIEKNKHAEIFYGNTISIESDTPMTWVAEGEIFSTKSTRIEIGMNTKKVNLIIPEEWKYDYQSESEKEKARKSIAKGTK